MTDVTGTVSSVQRAVLAAKVMGAIQELPVALGQTVRENDVLLRIFSADAEARVVQARAQLNVAQRDLERESSLLEKGASTDQTVRNLQDRVTGSEAMLRDAEVQLGYTVIRAPFNGVVARKWVNAGDLASPGNPLVAIEGASAFEIEANIPESLAAGLKPGAAIECSVGETRFTGTLREISSMADRTTRSVGVRIDVPPDAKVRSGQFTRVSVPGSSVRTLLVPVDAVSVNGQMERVFVAGDDGNAAIRIVKTGAMRGGNIEILSGLAGGERVVVAPPAGLREGQPLEAQP